MKRKLLLIAAMLFTGVCIPACNEDNDEDKTTEAVKPAENNRQTFSGNMVVGEYSRSDVKVELVYVSGTELNIKLNKVKFSEAMPIELDIELKGITYTKENDIITFASSEIIPYVAGGEMPDYKMNNLEGRIENETLQLRCERQGMAIEYTGMQQ